MTRTALLRLVLLVAVTATPLAAQSRARTRDRDRNRDRDRDDIEARLDTTLALARGGLVDLSLVSGEILVTGAARGDVRIVATSERGELELDASASRIVLAVRSRRNHAGETHYEVTVPFGARVIGRAVSGEVNIRGTQGAVEAHSVSGDVIVDDTRGATTLESVSGEVRGSRIGGDLDVRSVSGDVDLDDVRGDAHVETVSGSITLPRAASRDVRMETVSGDIQYGGTIEPTGRYEFRSHSGDVMLTLPSNVSAEVGVETFSGDLETDFPLTLQPGAREIGVREQRFDFTLGAGGARITAQTFSGDIHLERGPSASSNKE